MDRKTTELIERINKESPRMVGEIRAAAAASADGDTMRYEISVSSETPYARWNWEIGEYVEILGHKASEVDLGWMASGNAPLLLQHDHSKQIGVIESARISDGRVTAVVRFGKGALAKEIEQDVADGIRKNVSVGYQVDEMVLVKKGSGSAPAEYRVNKWRPHEASIVSVPADQSVGTNRAVDQKKPIKKENTVDEQKRKELARKLGLNEEASIESIMEAQSRAAKAEAKGEADNELKRQAAIRELASAHRDRIADIEDRCSRAVRDNVSIESFRREILDCYTDGTAKIQSARTFSKQEARDLSKFSFVKAIREQSKGLLTGLELEMHTEAEKEMRQLGQNIAGVGIPAFMLNSRAVTVTGEGADVVPTAITGWIDLLRNRMVCQQLGARMLTGMTGNFHIPRMSASGGAAWEGENDANEEGSQTIDQVAFSPKRVGHYTSISKQLLIQSSPDIERMVREDLALAIAIAIDRGAIAGASPVGILSTQGIGSVAGGDNGAAPTLANLIDLETAVSSNNADMGARSYLTNTKVRGKLKKTAIEAGHPDRVWKTGAAPLNEYACAVSNQVPDNLVKGGSGATCSAIIFGNWNDLVIAQWGGLDLVVDPYTLATTNLLRLVANAYADVGVRHPESFAAMADALTV